MNNTNHVVQDGLPKQLTIKQVSKIFGISEWTIRSWVSKRHVPHRRIGRRVYIPTVKFITWLNKHDVEGSMHLSNKSKLKEVSPNV